MTDHADTPTLDVEQTRARMRSELTAAGDTVLRTTSYRRLLERVRVAEALHKNEVEFRKSAERWGLAQVEETRRIRDRLDRVVAAAAALGVDIRAINAALDDPDLVEARPGVGTEGL